MLSWPKRILAVILAIVLVVSFTPLPSNAESSVGLPGNLTMLSMGSDDDSGATADDSALATAADGDGAEPASQLMAEVIDPDAIMGQDEDLGSEDIDAQAAKASHKEGDTITIDTKLNLIQEGTYVPPETADGKSVQFASSLSAASIQQVKNRINTALMNPKSSGVAIDINLFDFKIPMGEKDYLKSWIEEVINTNPDLFYMSGNMTYSFSYSNGNFYTDTLSVKYSMSASNIARYRTSYENGMQTAMSWIPANATEFQKAKAAHDYLVRNVQYHTQAASIGGSSWQAQYGNTTPWTAYGAFVDKKCVCEGYSLAYMAILARVGVESTFVTQWQGNSGHGWNRVKVNGKWYNVDVTFDDPLPDRGSSSTPSTTYFIKSDKWFKANPSSGWHASWNPAGVAGSDTSYDSYNWNTSAWTYAGPSSTNTNPTSLTITSPANTKSSAPYTMLADSRLQLTISTTQSSTTQPGRATWSSSNPGIVAVNSSGIATTGKATGSATITCKLGTKTAYCYITVVTSGTQIGSVSKSIVWTGNSSYLGNNQVRYSGQNVKPKVNLTHAGKTLTQGRDYTLSYSSSTDSANCVLPGTCTITIYGANGYIGTTTLTYYILGDLAQCTINSPTVSYTGMPVKPVPTLKFKTATLKEGTDFTVTYPTDTTSTGTKTATVKGKGGYTGTKTFTYTIKKAASTGSANWYRLWGEKALDTMEAVTKEFGSSSTYAIVTNNVAYRDALAASGLAGALNAPVFMTDKESLSKQTWRELVRLKVKTVYIVGSDEKTDPSGYTISRNVEAQLKGLGDVSKVIRVGNKSVSGRSVGAAQAMPTKSKTVIIAIQTSYRDALSISTYAYASKSPILYVERDKALGDHVVKYIKDGGFTKALIVGGPNPIPKSVDDQLVKAGINRNNITRLAGENAYNTSRIIAEWSTGGLPNGTGGGSKSNFYYYSYVKFQPDVRMNWNKMGAAQARGWRDGISSTALCGRNRAVVLLVDHTDTSNVALIGRNKTKISEGYVFGGEGAFKKWVYDDIVKATKR